MASLWSWTITIVVAGTLHAPSDAAVKVRLQHSISSLHGSCSCLSHTHTSSHLVELAPSLSLSHCVCDGMGQSLRISRCGPCSTGTPQIVARCGCIPRLHVGWVWIGGESCSCWNVWTPRSHPSECTRRSLSDSWCSQGCSAVFCAKTEREGDAHTRRGCVFMCVCVCFPLVHTSNRGSCPLSCDKH
jgi:hypothetical protein